MAGSFFGLSISSAGLFSSQKNLEVINHNITNANTPGYSRQEAVQKAVKPYGTNDGTGMIGGGSYILKVDRIRDEYLDTKYWGENVTSGEWEVKRNLLADMQSVFAEPSDTGLVTVMNEFYGSLQEITKDPSSPSARSVLQQNAVTLTKYINNLAVHFEELQVSVNQTISSEVSQVNSLGEQIKRINHQIFNSELGGHIANDLRDQRTLLLDQLSALADITVSEEYKGKLPGGLDDKRLVVSIGGKAFIQHDKVMKLELIPREIKLNTEDAKGMLDLVWDDGSQLLIRSGKIKGYMDIRDGNAGINGSPSFNGIPSYIRKLDNFARKFTQSFNEGYVDVDGDSLISAAEDGIGHVDGFGIDTDGDSGTKNAPTGLRFFTYKDGTGNSVDSKTFTGEAVTTTEIMDKYDNLTAKNLSINPDMLNNYYSFAASDNATQEGNIVLAQKLIETRHNFEMFSEGAPEDYMKSLITTVAIDMQQATRMQENHKILKSISSNRRLSDSGVSLDEEMSNMVKHQQAYNASAKMIAIWSEIYDILLNRTGL